MTEVQIKLAEECGRAMMSEAERDLILGRTLPSDDNCHTAYLRGQLLSTMRVRLSIIDQAAGGSSPAQALAVELIKQCRAANA